MTENTTSGSKFKPPGGDWKPSPGCDGNAAGGAAPLRELATGASQLAFPEPEGFPHRAAEDDGAAAAVAGGGGLTNSHPQTPVRALTAGFEHQQDASVVVGVDWLTASMPKCDRPDTMISTLADLLRSKGEPVTGGHGYSGIDVAGGTGRLLWRGFNDETADVLVILPGRALDWARGNVPELDNDQAVARFFIDHQFRATRLDIAMDTTDVALNPHVVLQHLRADHFTSRCKQYGLTGTYERGRYEPGKGETVYLGGRTSTRYLRAYDKQAEVLHKIGTDIGHLTRFELEHKREAAAEVLRLIANDGPSIIPGLFAAWVNFRDPSDDASRIERRRSVDWWDRLVRNKQPIVLGLRRGIATPETALHWVKHQVAKTLRLAEECGFGAEIQRAVADKTYVIKESERESWHDFATRRETAR